MQRELSSSMMSVESESPDVTRDETQLEVLDRAVNGVSQTHSASESNGPSALSCDVVTPFTIMPRSAAAVEQSLEEFLSPNRVFANIAQPAPAAITDDPPATSSLTLPVRQLQTSSCAASGGSSIEDVAQEAVGCVASAENSVEESSELLTEKNVLSMKASIILF